MKNCWMDSILATFKRSVYVFIVLLIIFYSVYLFYALIVLIYQCGEPDIDPKTQSAKGCSKNHSVEGMHILKTNKIISLFI